MGLLSRRQDGKVPPKMLGKTRAFCFGLCVSRTDWRTVAGTWLMVAAPSVAWEMTVGVFFLQRYTAALPALIALLTFTSLALLLLTANSDPGILPRQKDFVEQVDLATGSVRRKQPERHLDIVLRNRIFRLKYCIVCNLYRPPRCSHCSVCENCVEGFDHHCPWIGNCVGRRNYWLFYTFLCFTAVLNVLSLATALAHISIRWREIELTQDRSSMSAFVHALRKEPVPAALTIYCVLFVWFTVGLCMYHTYLIATNQTTYENIKGVYSTQGSNPFDRGTLSNFMEVFCSPARPRHRPVPPAGLRVARSGGPACPGPEHKELAPAPPARPAPAGKATVVLGAGKLSL